MPAVSKKTPSKRERREDEPLRSGELARVSGVSADTLRHYERKGLLKPRRAPNGYREYPRHAVEPEIPVKLKTDRVEQTEVRPTAGCSDSRKRDVRREEVPRRSRVGAIINVGRATDRVACDGNCDEEARAVVIQEIRPARIAETGSAVADRRVLRQPQKSLVQ